MNERIFLSPPHMSGNEQALVAEAFASNYVAPAGSMLNEFEREFSRLTDIPHCLALSSVQPSNSAPGSWWNRLAPLVTEVDLQAQATAGHGAEAAAPTDAPETFTIPSLPALPEALQTARVHTAAGLEGDAPVAMPGDAESTPLSRQGDAMHQLLEQARFGEQASQLGHAGAGAQLIARHGQHAFDHGFQHAAGTRIDLDRHGARHVQRIGVQGVEDRPDRPAQPACPSALPCWRYA